MLYVMYETNKMKGYLQCTNEVTTKKGESEGTQDPVLPNFAC